MATDERRVFQQAHIERISRIAADTYTGLTGTEIGRFLAQVKIRDVSPEMTKWKRLYNAFVEAHNTKGSDNHILSFIAVALAPARFTGDTGHYYSLISEVNEVLSFLGLEFHDDGRFHKIKKASSLSEATKRANLLRDAVNNRELHPVLLEFCREELLQDNYFHAVLEASKGVAEMIRRKTGLKTDGAELVDEVFGGSDPILRINGFSTDTEMSEQRGFLNLLKGLFGTFRNPTAHAPRIEWSMSKEDALDLFSLASYAFRRIEAASTRGQPA